MIRSFKSRGTVDIFNGLDTADARRSCPTVLWQKAMRLLAQLNEADRLSDMALPPGNRLEKLTGMANASWSVRINRQYRLVFDWLDGEPANVKIEDYH